MLDFLGPWTGWILAIGVFLVVVFFAIARMRRLRKYRINSANATIVIRDFGSYRVKHCHNIEVVYVRDLNADVYRFRLCGVDKKEVEVDVQRRFEFPKIFDTRGYIARTHPQYHHWLLIVSKLNGRTICARGTIDGEEVLVGFSLGAGDHPSGVIAFLEAN